MCIADKMPRRKLRGLSIVQNLPNSKETNSEQQTGIGYSNVPNTDDEPTEIQRYIGIIARNANLLPINYESWHHMLDSNKNQALDNIKERFALEVSDNYVKKALGKKWRDHKRTLKKEYFKKNISLEENLRNVPPRMLRYQWEDVVRFWNSKKGEDCERVGTTSRQKQKFMHTTGSKSFACVAEDEEKLKDKKEEYEAIASSDSSVNLDNIDNRIITEVLGPERYGQVRFQGSFVNPTQFFWIQLVAIHAFGESGSS
ncbi:Envelope glycoprotein H [Gossypium arboreum]|uniref:Envelope glycoprotein H n=1 Tax=Gossypium arboreum TaxID=29729 RepID=A0A0B0MVP7_GOSAR|nr:Envelope glycoprotein H [Gossypium arboreum]